MASKTTLAHRNLVGGSTRADATTSDGHAAAHLAASDRTGQRHNNVRLVTIGLRAGCRHYDRQRYRHVSAALTANQTFFFSSRASARLQTFSTVNPYSRISTGPGAEEPK